MLELATLVARNARHFPDRLAVVFEDQRFTWAQFSARVARTGNALRSLGIEKGDRVATVMPNCLELLETYWACTTIGAILVPLSPLMQASGLTSLLCDAGASCAIASRSVWPESAAADLPLKRIMVGSSVQEGLDYATITANASTEIEPAQCEEGDVFNIMYTSGTTGMPKGIVHTHGIRSLLALQMGNALRISSASVIVHSGALVFNGAFVTMLPAFANAGTYVLMPQFDAEKLMSVVEREFGTHIGVVPSQLIAMFDAPGFDAARLKSLESVMSLGAPLLQIYKDRLHDVLPGRLCEIYGLTEGFATFLDRRDARSKSGSVGAPLPFSSARIIDEQGRQLPPNKVGEIVGKGPLLMPGYHERPDLTAQAVRDGWLHTGDMGYVDADGFLYLADRKKDMIDSGGIKIYPKDIEEVVSQHPAVRDVAVFGVPHDKWGETPIAAVLLHGHSPTTADSIRDWVNERVAAKYQRLSEVVIHDDFPRSVAGKTLKRELREPYWERTGRSI